ncbi:hypothetical protein RCL1_003844 [Eukaryota sp. TZLM3-RCL]
MEVRVLVPASMVCCLDFLECVFGSAGDPFMPLIDAGIDQTWSGHTGMIIAAPHVRTLKKKDIGLPHWDEATEKQRQDKMCWKNEDELYHDGQAFNLWFRTKHGHAVILVTDSYFGYYKKTVKALLSFASNLSFSEEEHAGGCLAFSSYNLGTWFKLRQSQAQHWDNGMTLEDVASVLGDSVIMTSQGYALDKRFPDVVYVNGEAEFSVPKLTITFPNGGGQGKPTVMKLLRGKTYVLPCGYRVFLQSSPSFHLVGQVPEGLFCHKPASVSGSGKSEISKPITNHIIRKPFWVSDLKSDLDLVYAVITHDYSKRFRKGIEKIDNRSFLSDERSLGSAIKLLTPSADYNDNYNRWLGTIRSHVRSLAFLVKQVAKEDESWQDRFSIQVINGSSGHELYLDGKPMITSYLRVGFEANGEWKLFRCRSDFAPSGKIALEDDISTSVIVPLKSINPDLLSQDTKHLAELTGAESVKMVTNCEYKFFQRADDAHIPGADKEAEADFSLSDPQLRDFVHAPSTDATKYATGHLFTCNYEPLTPEDAVNIVEDCINFDRYTDTMQRTISAATNLPIESFWVSTSHPRLVDGKPTANPRYLQFRPDLVSRKGRYLSEVSARLTRKIGQSQPIHVPVGAVILGRRCNNSSGGVRSMSCYNPLHYQELPEAMAELMCCLTGKSPSTTGAGAELAMTKGPFNSIRFAADLNATFISTLLTGTDIFSSAAGVCGEKVRIDHDVSYLIPELFCRMTAEERVAKNLIANDFLEKLEDFKDANGEVVYASRLGYRINRKFTNIFLGRLFDSPNKVFDDAMLCPEQQDRNTYIDSIKNICQAQQRVCNMYIEDGTVNDMVPPLAFLCRIIAAGGEHDGVTMSSPEFRNMFTMDHLVKSDWYKARLEQQLKMEEVVLKRKIDNILSYRSELTPEVARQLDLDARLKNLEKNLEDLYACGDAHSCCFGYLGVEPSLFK